MRLRNPCYGKKSAVYDWFTFRGCFNVSVSYGVVGNRKLPPKVSNKIACIIRIEHPGRACATDISFFFFDEFATIIRFSYDINQKSLLYAPDSKLLCIECRIDSNRLVGLNGYDLLGSSIVTRNQADTRFSTHARRDVNRNHVSRYISSFVVINGSRATPEMIDYV